MRGTKTFVIAEENGLISVILAPQLAGARAKLPKHACRIRLNPPRSALREDNHVFDRAAALALVETNVIARITKAVPAATWTDTTIGGKRVTVSFGASRAKPIATVIELAGTLVPKGWKLEEAVVDPAPAQRLRALRHDAALAPKVSSKQIADGKRFAAALAKVPSPGSFRTQAGLHQTKLDARKISRALQWLSSVLPQADAPMRAVLGRAAAEAQLGVYINAHPRLRAFFFELGDGEDVVGLPLPMDEALARWLDVDLDDARRICGPLWQREMFQIAKAPRITVDASS